MDSNYQNSFYREDRPWGSFTILLDSDNFKVKRIDVLPNQKLSYQSHSKRSEVWTIVKGEADVIIDGKLNKLSYGESITIPLGAKHRIINPTEELLSFIEVQTGSYFGEDDIIRYEDDYGRQ